MANDENITKPDMLEFLKGLVRQRRIAGHHLDSMNTFYEEGIRSIVEREFKIENAIQNRRTGTAGSESDISEIKFHLNFHGTNISRPVIVDLAKEQISRDEQIITSGGSDIMYPAFARRLMCTYSIQVRIEAEVSATAYHDNGQVETRTAKVPEFRIGAIPCMVGSKLCNLYGASRQELINLGEDPNDDGGYFIIRGGEHSVVCNENITWNDIRITTEHHGKQTAHIQIWSKFGDGFENSVQFVVRQMATGAIMIEPQLYSQLKMQIPFYIFFRLLLPITDAEIAELIIGDIRAQDVLTVAMVAMLNEAFAAPIQDKFYAALQMETNHNTIALRVGENILALSQNALALKDSKVKSRTYEIMMERIDKQVLPHLGQNSTDRPKKARYVAYAIYKMFLTMLGIIEPLDRDSLRTKRMHAAGIAVSKAFKKMFNQTVSGPIKRQLTKAFDTSPFSQVNMANAVISAIKKDDLESAMMRAMTIGNTEVRVGRTVSLNRVSSQTRNLKNDDNAKAIANNIDVQQAMSNKQTIRADLIRRVHSTHIGYLDILQSADTGDKVGMNKQIAVSAIISIATPGLNLKNAIISEEGDKLLRADTLSVTEERRQHLSSVFVNGDCIGYVRNDWEFVQRWYKHRRQVNGSLIHRHTSIFRDPSCREVMFWTDYGRMLRPLVIVYNNLEEYNAKCRAAHKAGTAPPPREEFTQWTRLTGDIIVRFLRGEVDMDWLLSEGVLEYIAMDECENQFLAPNIEYVRLNRHNLSVRYTHCDIEQSIYGLTTLTAPLTNHSYAIRTTYYINQRKQSCSWYSLAFPFRTDKKTMLQYYCEKPIVSCFADDLMNPNGHNCMVAIMVYTGYNQEDSMFVNASSVQRGMFNGSFFDYELATCGKGESFTLPEGKFMVEKRNDAISDYLVDGVARIGTMVDRNYVLIKRVQAIEGDPSANVAASRGMMEQKYVDKSIIYTGRTPAYIEHIDRGEDERRIKFIRVKFRQPKNIIRGDKCSSRTGNKGIVSRLVPSCDLPFAEDGIVPDIVINPQSIPTRRALNQLLESLLGEYGAIKGCHVDGTSIMPIDVDAVIAELAKFGFKHVGYRRMYNGMTGDWLDLPVCLGPTTYMRLEKFVANECRAIKTGFVDSVTHQPIRAGVERGALKIGEMEIWSMVGHGLMRSLCEKIIHDSDETIIHVCRRCGNCAIYNAENGLYMCKVCRQLANIVAVPSTWSSNLMREEVRTLGVKMQFEVEPHKYFANN